MSTINPLSISLEVISATTTAWVPLPTSRLTENEACYNQIYEPGVNFLVAFDVVYARDVFPTATKCLPVEVASWWLQDQKSAPTVTKLGPNFECPAMYSEVQVLLESRSTAYIQCCPTGYKLASAASPKGFAPTQCTSKIIKNQVITYAYGAQGGFVITSTTNTGTPSVVYAQHVNGYSIQTTSSSSSSAFPTTSSTITSSASLAQNTTTSGAGTIPADSGLSTGATVGIGIGAGLVGLIALLALVWFLARRRKAKQEGGTVGEQQPVFEKDHDPTRTEIGSGGVAHSHFEPVKVDPKTQRPYELQ